jgi:hypothetical protein
MNATLYLNAALGSMMQWKHVGDGSRGYMVLARVCITKLVGSRVCSQWVVQVCCVSVSEAEWDTADLTGRWLMSIAGTHVRDCACRLWRLACKADNQLHAA